MAAQNALLSNLSKLNPSQWSQLLSGSLLGNPKDKGEIYTIYVHIIECRDLKPLSDDGICDPVVSVKILSQKKSTNKQKRTFCPYFDQILLFKMNLNFDQLSSEKITISVYDTNHFVRNDPVGSYQYDLSLIYASKQHEIYRQWTGLFDPHRISQGIKGYLKCSIAVLGPKDDKFIHSAADQIENDNNMSNIILPPFIEYKYKQLIVQINASKFLCNLTTTQMTRKYLILVQFSDKKLKSKEFPIATSEETVHWNMNALLALRVPNFDKTVTISILQNISV